jgi:GNAT superfamily N-acetyltransferase
MPDLLKTTSLALYDGSGRHNASIVRLTRDLAQTQIDGKWWALEDVPQSERKYEIDRKWKWAKEVGSHRNQLVWDAVGVICSEDFVEGAMIYRVDAKSLLDVGEGAIYVELIASAPRNRPWLVTAPLYKGVGSALLLWAVSESYRLGLGGRVWLESTQTPSTLRFYERRGFVRIEEIDDEVARFEISRKRAEKWLREEGLLRDEGLL